MKTWTVMLIPHDRGSSRTLNVSAYQVWLVVVLLCALSFAASFLYKRHQIVVHEIARLQQTQRDLETQYAKQTAAAATSTTTAQERIEMERRLRAEYDASVAAVTAKLSALADLEAQARRLTGIAPRPSSKSGTKGGVGGRGGGTSAFEAVAYEPDQPAIVVPSVIEGLSEPSADMIVQEINLRTESLQALVAGIEAKQELVARMPSRWPTASMRRDISSPFGYRKDPYSMRIALHDGCDITAPYGSPVLATAKGVVISSEYDSGGLGNLVKIDHGNGVQTWYGHMSSLGVKAGQKVDRGEAIGKLGSTGRSTGPHIHYEVHVNGRAVDPAKYLSH